MIRASSASALVSPPLPPHLSPLSPSSSSISTKQLNKATCNHNFHDVVVDEKENLNSTQQRKQQQHNFLQQLYLHHQKIKQQHEQHKRAGTKLEKANRVKYGELIVLGYNGCIELDGSEHISHTQAQQQSQRIDRRKSKYVLERREKPNGVKPSTQHNCKTSLEINNCLSTTAPSSTSSSSSKTSSQTTQNQSHSVTYTLSRNHTVVVKYAQDEQTDMFQIGRSTESTIDFIVLDNANVANQQSTISRYAARITVEREPPHTARIYAAGFDSSKRIFLGEKATKWTSNDDKGELDGVTTNGVLIMHPNMNINDLANATKLTQNNNEWLEVSVCGAVFTLNDSRLNSPSSHHAIVNSKKNTYSNILKDGTLIDLCGATLMWRSRESLTKTADKNFLDVNLKHLNEIRPQCPVGLKTLIFPSSASPLIQASTNVNQQRPTAKNSINILNKSTDSSPSNSSSSSSNLFVLSSPSLNSIVGPNHGLNRSRNRNQHHTTRIPMVYLRCGHVHGQHDWGVRNRSSGAKPSGETRSSQAQATSRESSSLDLESACLDLRECPLCRKVGPYVKLIMGLEPSVYFDEIKLNTSTGSNQMTTNETSSNYFKPYAFVPCGHMASELTCKYWSRVKVPQGSTQGLFSICPFCAKKLDAQQPFIKLIFQEGC